MRGILIIWSKATLTPCVVHSFDAAGMPSFHKRLLLEAVQERIPPAGSGSGGVGSQGRMDDVAAIGRPLPISPVLGRYDYERNLSLIDARE